MIKILIITSVILPLSYFIYSHSISKGLYSEIKGSTIKLDTPKNKNIMSVEWEKVDNI